ncbi:MAG: hypothetical protein A2747_01665 [Candidatus Yonathbacteria bacterium RIFCSPHIGHO2_01_FULL_44_41]|uniref:SHS2 domain-containing protein n=1 Tax=Candidatus Yonathbacteria bacterium RIFCSPHIGHO2_02_FULL_44_14 TaxID=1802724 RepID=A0A1G2SB18_9BACT|nr:MAG: hypothetical protein A2747_01665 [Candidatus Yonathbacteria bacterium RIFCSPHIGHO2_01_FULL_44_41]OHA81571.1 MAG: hypothetical protein A3D51_02240 [Candidatus Yonathbacteria bacterium RIFCSPHIGHO2_02_FULL_44_14]OHA81752.1 MAG: hypothetical protein A3B06_02175 [Candidatus Yonathbacteria bacterium RIFCSPLOWO2_01_FULL_43_20]
MALSFFTKQKQDESLVLLVDIGSASVGGALVKIEKGSAPHILVTVRENISFQDALSPARFLVAMNRSLDKVLKTMQIKTNPVGLSQATKPTGLPAHIFCTLSSPWFILKSRHLRIAHQEEFEVTERILDEFINEDIALLKEELKETLPPKDVKIIEKKIVQIKLNGYEVRNPYGQKTSRIELSMIVGVSSGKVVESIERKLSNFFHVKSVHFGAFPIAAFSAIRDIFPNEKNFLFIDITGEATDVSLVSNDILAGTVAFSRGKNFFIREISTQLHTVHEEAATLFAMFLRDELDAVQHSKIAAIVAHTEDEWLMRFKKAIGILKGNGMLPFKVFFTADADIAPMLSRLIGTTKLELLKAASLDVQYLDQHIVAKFVSFEAEVTRDPFIVVEALLTEKLFKQHT